MSTIKINIEFSESESAANWLPLTPAAPAAAPSTNGKPDHGSISTGARTNQSPLWPWTPRSTPNPRQRPH